MVFFTGFQEQKKIKTIHDYLIFGSNMPPEFFTWTLFATNVSLSSIFIGLAAAGYVYGYASLWIVVSWCAGVFVFWRFYNRVFDFFQRGKTLHEFLQIKYQSADLRQVAAFFTIVAFVSTVGIEFYAGFVLLSAFGLPIESKLSLVLLMALLCIFYSALGGFRSVARTNRDQSYLIILGAGVLVLGLFLARKQLFKAGSSLPEWSLADANGFVSNPTAIFGFFMLFLPFLISAMDSWQRCAALSKRPDAKAVVRKGLLLGTIGFVFIYTIPILFGISALSGAFGAKLAQNDVLFTTIFAVFGQLSPILRAIALAAILLCFVAAMLSTASTLLVTAVYSLIYDILAVRRGMDLDNLSDQQHKKLIGVSQIWVMIFGFAATGICFLGLSLQDLIFAFFSAQIVIAVPLFVAAYWPRFAEGRAVSAIACLCCGFCAPIALVIASKLTNDQQLKEVAPIAGFALGSLSFLFLSPIKRQEAHR